MRIFRFILASCLAILLLGSCKKDSSFGMKFEKSGYYFDWGGNEEQIPFIPRNLAGAVITSVTDGWKAEMHFDKSYVTVTPPKDPGTEEERDNLRTAKLRLRITSNSGDTATVVVNLRVLTDSEYDLSKDGHYANCYIVNRPQALYSFDCTRRGDGSRIDQDVVSVSVIWATSSSLIEDADYDAHEGRFYFVVGRAQDEESQDIKIDGKFVSKRGNALVGAYSLTGELLWSWHIWCMYVDDDPAANAHTYSNGKTFMSLNLGAFRNSDGNADEEAILDQYGLYYQWGRKEPFFTPMYFDCTNNHDRVYFTATGKAVYLDFADINEGLGYKEYALTHPTTYITNEDTLDAEHGDKRGDWLSEPDANLWKDDVKTLQDPCPYGWKVPAKRDFDVLKILEADDSKEVDEAKKMWGWHLTDGTVTDFYPACGYRRYNTGILHNMNYKDQYPYTPQPWEGYYWTAGTTSKGLSTCMYFDLTTTRTVNKFNLSWESFRANGMQIRCVKID